MIAAGPWSAELAPACRSPPLWGVVVELELPDAPLHVLEEAGIDALTRARTCPDVLFSRRHRARHLRDRLDVHARAARTRRRSRRGSSRTRRRFLPGPGDAAARAARLRAADLGRRAAVPRAARRAHSTWPAATARGGSRSGRLRRGSWPIRCWGGRRRSRRPCSATRLAGLSVTSAPVVGRAGRSSVVVGGRRRSSTSWRRCRSSRVGLPCRPTTCGPCRCRRCGTRGRRA